MIADSPRKFLTTGEFARQTRLTAKALRLYNEIGLLGPADLDAASGHRHYGADQVRTGRLIGMLRGADLSLAEIGLLLADLPGERELASRRLDRHLIELEARHTSRRFLIRHIRAILREEDYEMFAIRTRHVPAQRVMSIQRRLRAPETAAFVEEAKAAFADYLGGVAPTGPFTLIFHGIVDHESDGPLEAIVGCPDEVQVTALIGVRTRSGTADVVSAGLSLRRVAGQLAALPPAIGTAVIGELLAVVSKGPGAELDPVAGVQGLSAHRLAVHAAPGGAPEVGVDVLVSLVAPDFGVPLVESGQAQIRARATADDGHPGQQIELALAAAGGRAAAEREDQPRSPAALRVMRGRHLHRRPLSWAVLINLMNSSYSH